MSDLEIFLQMMRSTGEAVVETKNNVGYVIELIRVGTKFHFYSTGKLHCIVD